ncbi:hypothetical protein [Candidatus Pseudothioglobus sp. Uisw_016]|uniref:hypothetical protein n=1 Tax=Candidatus Pseudothioglobus sp. Uisw_016 TaxID=3230995 RepID=UPI003A8B4C70
MALKKIAIGGISTECSSYSPLHQKKDDFQSIQGQALLDLIDFPFNGFDIKPCPLFFNKSAPGAAMDWISTTITALFAIGFFIKSR